MDEESQSLPPACFIGDLEDAWVAAIADALPIGSPRIGLDSVAELDDATPRNAGCLVLHRSHLSYRGEAILRRWREAGQVRRVVLIAGPYARHADLQRWSPLADVVLWDATARETVARHLESATKRGSPPTRSPALPRVSVVSTLNEWRMTLTEMCLAAGFAADPARDWDQAPANPLAVWDVPLLEPDWHERLASRKGAPRVVAVMGFADRDAVARARQAGADACLDAPCDPDDLAFVLQRLARPPAPTPAPLPRARGSARFRDDRAAAPHPKSPTRAPTQARTRLKRDDRSPEPTPSSPPAAPPVPAPPAQGVG